MTYEERKAQVRSYLGKAVRVEIDRPIGYIHHKEKYDLQYPINYGYIPGVLGGDGEELDVYVLGIDTPVKECTVMVIGIAHREDDVEDNNGNSESVCWLYDCDYSYLTSDSITQIVFAGPRCRDHLLRARLAGVDAAKIRLEPDPRKAAQALDLDACRDIYLLHDMYRAADTAVVRKEIIARLEGGNGSEN